MLPAAGGGAAAEVPADRAWDLLAPAIAPVSGRVRLSRDGGRSYPSRWERPLGARPTVPAAVRLYDGAGRARVLALDLDAKLAGRAQVLADCALAVRWLGECGGLPVVDESVSGGRHVYLLLEAVRPAEEILPVLRALRTVLPSLDPTPMSNPVTGCLRPPGSAHPRGGSQTLVTAWPAAVRAVNVRADDRVWAALCARLADLRPGKTSPARAVPVAGSPAGDGRGTPLAGPLAGVAASGAWDASRYATGSEARYAVLCSLAARGWSGPAVLAGVESGLWPGLRELYAKYRGRWRKSLVRDWTSAELAVSSTHNTLRHPPESAATAVLSNDVSVRNTREQLTHPPHPGTGENLQSTSGTRQPQLSPGLVGEGEYRWIRIWWACVTRTRTEVVGASGLTRLAVLHALGAAAQKTGSRTVAFGTRSLALASGVDHSTVSRVLRDLRDEADPLVELLEAHRGPAGDLYQLRIPDRLLTVAAGAQWPAGRIPGVHPVFRVLGLAAWAAHHTLTSGAVPSGPVSVGEVELATGLSRAATYRALDVLADAGLARRILGGWTVGGRSLDVASDLLGGTALVAALRARYVIERAAWRLFLRLLTDRGTRPADGVRDIVVGEWVPLPPEPPPDPGPSPLQLIQEILGGVLIDTGS